VEKKVIFAGFGGQGVLLMGTLLSHAVVAEGKEVVMMQSYGTEMRGGTSNCAVTISDKDIGSPIVEKAHGCVVMNLPSLERFGPMVRTRGVLIINSSLIHKEPDRKGIHCFAVPATGIADQLGNRQVANLVALGAFIEATKLAEAASILKALKRILPKHRQSTLPLNEKAFQEGREWVKERLRK